MSEINANLEGLLDQAAQPLPEPSSRLLLTSTMRLMVVLMSPEHRTWEAGRMPKH
jgi:hypothetical protein